MQKSLYSYKPTGISFTPERKRLNRDIDYLTSKGVNKTKSELRREEIKTLPVRKTLDNLFK